METVQTQRQTVMVTPWMAKLFRKVYFIHAAAVSFGLGLLAMAGAPVPLRRALNLKATPSVDELLRHLGVGCMTGTGPLGLQTALLGCVFQTVPLIASASIFLPLAAWTLQRILRTQENRERRSSP